MRRFFCFLALAVAVCAYAFGQAQVDTLYFNSEGKSVPNKAFASYYKVFMKPGSSAEYGNLFRDFYPNGTLAAEGKYISIDPKDDSKSVLDGEYTRYFENGLVLEHAFYKDGKLDGTLTRFSMPGDSCITCVQIEYSLGKPVNDYYLVTREGGSSIKVSLDNNEPMWESASPDELKTKFIDGREVPYYVKNGMIVMMEIDKVKDYGKYYQASISISNNSAVSIDFDPTLITSRLYKGDEEIDLRVYSSDEYMSKVKRKQNTAMIFSAIAVGLAAGSAGYSYSTYKGTTYTPGHHGVSHTYGSVVTYDAAAAFQTHMMAGSLLSDMGNEMSADRQYKEMGYYKLNTIEPGECVTGYVNIERKKGESIDVNIDILGAIYPFHFELGK